MLQLHVHPVIDDRPRKSDSLDALLARGRMGGPLREEVAVRVIDARAARGRWRAVAFVAGPVLALAAGVLIFIGPRHEFAAKGSAGTAAAVLEVVCSSGESGACARGEELFFRVENARVVGFLEAWAEPAGGGERTWYFVGDGALPVRATPDVQTLARAVRLGPEQPLGVQRIHLLFSRAPLAQSEVPGKRGEILAEASIAVDVRTMTAHPRARPCAPRARAWWSFVVAVAAALVRSACPRRGPHVCHRHR